jgi:hypothetical protein
MKLPLRPRLWLALALALVLAAVAWLWLRGAWLGGGRSPLPTLAPGLSPLPTPAPSTPLSHWVGGGAVLLWVTLGIMLALLIALVIVYWPRRVA